MDFLPFASPKQLSFAPDGTYQVPLDPGFPLLLRLYRFSQPHPSIPNQHECLEITLVLAGSGVFTIGGRKYAAAAGDIFAVPGRTFHLLEADDERLENVTVYFTPELISVPGTSDVNLEYLLLFAGEQQRVSAKIDIDSSASRRVLAIMGRMSDELCGQETFFRMAAKNHLCSILLILNRAAALTPVVTPHVQLRLRDIQKLQPVFDRIHHRFSERLALSDLAEAVEMSVAQLCRYFKRVTGQTVSEYVRRYRIDRAKELLIGDIHSITWIAYEVGFESHSYFDRVFNQLTRQTPQEFRKSYARRLPVEDGTAGHPRGE